MTALFMSLPGTQFHYSPIDVLEIPGVVRVHMDCSVGVCEKGHLHFHAPTGTHIKPRVENLSTKELGVRMFCGGFCIFDRTSGRDSPACRSIPPGETRVVMGWGIHQDENIMVNLLFRDTLASKWSRGEFVIEVLDSGGGLIDSVLIIGSTSDGFFPSQASDSPGIFLGDFFENFMKMNQDRANELQNLTCP